MIHRDSIKIDLPTFNEITLTVDTCQAALESVNQQLILSDSIINNRDSVVYILRRSNDERTVQLNLSMVDNSKKDQKIESQSKTIKILTGVVVFLTGLLYISK